MAAYLDELILTAVVCRIVTMIAPDGDMKRRYLGAVCGLVTILTLISPVKSLMDTASERWDAWQALFSSPAEAEYDRTEEELRSAASVIFAYAGERYGFDTEGAEITFFTDDGGRADEIMVFFRRGSEEKCGRLAEELERELGITVHVYTAEVKDGG